VLDVYAETVDPASALGDSKLCLQWLRAFWTDATRSGLFPGILIMRG
jgi:hypothetical protein